MTSSAVGSGSASGAAAFALLARTPYVLLTTFRRTGVPVATAVWVVEIDGRLWVWTSPTAGKVKRIRHTARVLLQPCSRTGSPVGSPVEAEARIEDPANARRVLSAIGRKYGLLGRLSQLGAFLGERLGPIVGRSKPRGVLSIAVL